MSDRLKWVCNNLSLGGLLRIVGSTAGTAANYALTGIGATVAYLAGNSDSGAKIQDGCSFVGESLDTTLSKTGEGVGYLADKTIQISGEAVGQAAGGIAKLAGASEDNVMIATKVGTVAGAMAVGFLAGSSIASAAVAASAATGTTGAAATTSGLAALGGGAVATGGGGIAAGQAVVQAIAATSALSGAAALGKEDVEHPTS
ncbi:MAG TPA: hypothetical protein VE735_01985 [Gammaproteobacteria bacterium]|jgi:hypothetical protein|nr:hypothetical protein [Gammaproteobacteria bacterium]